MERSEILIPLVGSFVALSSLLVWVVKNLIRRSDAHISRLINVLEKNLTVTQTQLVEGQKAMACELSRLTVAVDKVCSHVESSNRS
jgi:hypothetical protein